jgi:GT2 family glycosyltransferase
MGRQAVCSSAAVATAVVQVDLEAVPESLRVSAKYTRALVVLRRRNAPVAQFYAPVQDGRLDGDAWARALRLAIGRRAWRWKVEDYLGPAPPVDLPACTVAICTRERPDDLRVALRAVTDLRPSPREILVIDNNPATDRSREVAAQFVNVRYVREDRPGLDAARNRALREASTAVVAFTDDDAAPERDWLAHLLRPFQDPRVWCTSGLTLPMELETPAQEWFERCSPFGRGFERQTFDGTRHDPLVVSRIGAGVSMALRREALGELGGFDEALDAGTATQSGGDHEMFARILSAGYRIVYEPAAVSWHRHRRTWEELRGALYGYGVGVYAMWTRKLLFDREPSVVKHAARWLWYGQLPRLWRSLRRHPDAPPLELLLAELRGCLAGPPAYFRARRHVRLREPM